MSLKSRSGAIIDARPLLDWLDRNPELLEGLQTEKKPKNDYSRQRNSVAKTVARLRRGEQTTFLRMDELCCFFGMHMSLLYGAEYWTLPIHRLPDAEVEPLELAA